MLSLYIVAMSCVITKFTKKQIATKEINIYGPEFDQPKYKYACVNIVAKMHDQLTSYPKRVSHTSHGTMKVIAVLPQRDST